MHRPLQQCGEVIPVDFAIAQDCRQETRADGLAGMDGYDRCAAVRMAQEVVTALDPCDLEARLPQGGHDLSAGDPRKASHATVIF
jgi:hypothetical protein